MTATAAMEMNDADIRGAINRMLGLGRNPQPLLLMIARLGEAQTRERFATETDPEGNEWKPSHRKLLEGGKTLTRDGILSGSITSQATIEFAEWGTNVEYAGIHQFGGEIRPKSAPALVFKLAGGKSVRTQLVKMPQRAFLGVNEQDSSEFLDAIERKIVKLSGAH